MRRGRPNIRQKIQPTIVGALSSNQTPLTISTISRMVSKELGRKISWNTVFKYVNELIETNKVKPLVLPHSKTANKEGLTVYILKQ